MDAKRELTSVDLRALSGELSTAAGAFVDKVYLYDDDFLRIKMRDPGAGRLELVVEVGATKRLHFADPDRIPDAPERPPNFAKMLRNRIANGQFVGADQYRFDRIVELGFEYEGSRITVVAELFGDGNIAVLDTDRTVIDCLRTVRLQSRTVAPGEEYTFPAARIDPLALSATEFEEQMRDSDADLVRTLATQLELGGEWAEELCTRAGVEKTRPVEAASSATLDALYTELSALGDALGAGDVAPTVYFDGESPLSVTPFELQEYDSLRASSYDRFTTAVDEYYTALQTRAEEQRATTNRPDFRAEIEKHERIIDQQEQAIEQFAEEAAAMRRRGELLYAYYDRVAELIQTVSAARAAGHDWDTIETRLDTGAEQGLAAAEIVDDVDPDAGRLRVTLEDLGVWIDPAESLEHNADRLYTEAKEIESKRAGAEEALEETRDKLAAIEKRRASWTAEEDTPEETETERSDDDWRSMASIPVVQSEPWYEQFRWYRTRDGFLVLGGRDADQNEALVKKYLEPGDRFLHTQARGGPVTVLKAAGPSESGSGIEIPAESEREAAAFAVSYSAVWKTGRYAGDVYAVDHDQVSKTPESGEYLEKGSFAVRGDRTYYRDVGVDVAVGITCDPETRVIGGPTAGIDDRAVTMVRVEPGRYAQGDVAKRIYRQFRERFTDTSFVRQVASPDRIQKFLPPGGSRIVDE